MDSLSLINENSLDYAAKFAELAEELAENTGHKKTQWLNTLDYFSVILICAGRYLYLLYYNGAKMDCRLIK